LQEEKDTLFERKSQLSQSVLNRKLLNKKRGFSAEGPLESAAREPQVTGLDSQLPRV